MSPRLGPGGPLREEGTQQESLISNVQEAGSGGVGVGGSLDDRSTLPPRQPGSRRTPRRRVPTGPSPVSTGAEPSDSTSEIRQAVSTGITPSLLDVGNPQLYASVLSQGTGAAGDEGHASLSGQGRGAEALLWAMLEEVMLYAPWSLAVLLGVQIWLIEVWEQ